MSVEGFKKVIERTSESSPRIVESISVSIKLDSQWHWIKQIELPRVQRVIFQMVIADLFYRKEVKILSPTSLK